MTSEEKVLAEIKSEIGLLMLKIKELIVTEIERVEFDKEKADYQILIVDYKKHKKALEEKYGKA